MKTRVCLKYFVNYCKSYGDTPETVQINSNKKKVKHKMDYYGLHIFY